jgi:hypothetical protein
MSERIIDKIRKLLALAGNNPSVEEAAAAFARAQDLATRHRIELASVEIGAEEDTELVQERVKASTGKRVMGWKKTLAWSMQSMGVYVLFYQGDGQFSFAGTKADVDTARYMFSAICAEIERLAKDQAYGGGRAYVNAFKLGAAREVCRRLDYQHAATMREARQAGTSETALARVADSHAVAKRWVKDDLGVRTSAAAAPRCSSWTGLDHGRRAGATIDLGGGKGQLSQARKALP